MSLSVRKFSVIHRLREGLILYNSSVVFSLFLTKLSSSLDNLFSFWKAFTVLMRLRISPPHLLSSIKTVSRFWSRKDIYFKYKLLSMLYDFPFELASYSLYLQKELVRKQVALKNKYLLSKVNAFFIIVMPTHTCNRRKARRKD